MGPIVELTHTNVYKVHPATKKIITKKMGTPIAAEFIWKQDKERIKQNEKKIKWNENIILYNTQDFKILWKQKCGIFLQSKFRQVR